jgi:tripartite-type tricarboxylate transporter receptor subunit TctC
MLKNFICIGLVAAVAVIAGPSAAQKYPYRPIRVVVPFPPGGTNDIIARIFVNQVDRQVPQPVIVDNRGGANGVIGTQAVAQAAPDGYTILHNSSSFTINAAVRKKLPYDIFKDFEPISTNALGTGYLAVVNPRLPVKTPRELVEYAKKNRVLYGSPGRGNPIELATELFNAHAGIKMEGIVFKGTGEALPALLSGEIHVMLVPVAAPLPAVQAGQLRAIGYTGDKAPKELPTITLFKDDVDGFVTPVAWHGWLAPARTPRPVIDELNRQLREAVKDPKVIELIEKAGYVVDARSPEAFKALLAENAALMKKAADAAGIEPQ